MQYTRANPSSRYRELVALYQQMHAKGKQERVDYTQKNYVMFGGFTMLESLPYVRAYVQGTGSQSILDYGCGKGLQYDLRNADIPNFGMLPSVQEYLGVKEIAKYDPAYTPYSNVPEGMFDGVICTDVLEHCPEEDIPWILGELFKYANKFVYGNVASYPAQKTLPNGENAHCTIRPVEWWKDRIREAAAAKPDVRFSFMMGTIEDGKIVVKEFHR